jgi:hypothetical protein
MFRDSEDFDPGNSLNFSGLGTPLDFLWKIELRKFAVIFNGPHNFSYAFGFGKTTWGSPLRFDGFIYRYNLHVAPRRFASPRNAGLHDATRKQNETRGTALRYGKFNLS